MRSEGVGPVDHAQPGDLRKCRDARLRVINSTAFQVTTNRNANHERRLPLVSRSPTQQRQLVANLVHRGPDVIEELNLDDGLESARSHADRATDDVCLREWRVKDAHAAILALQVRSNFEHAAFAFD